MSSLLLQSVQKRPLDLGRLCAGLQLQLPVYPHLLLRRSSIATGLKEKKILTSRLSGVVKTYAKIYYSEEKLADVNLTLL